MTDRTVRRRGPAIVVAWATSLMVLLVLTACGGDAEGSGAPPASDNTNTSNNRASDEGTSEPYDDGLAFVECMREEGIDMPDPEDEDSLAEAMSDVMDQYDQDTIAQAMSVCGELMPLQRPGHE